MEPFFKCSALLLLLAPVLSVPLQFVAVEGGQCASRCRADPQFVRFDSNKAYIYRIQTSTQIEGATGPDATPIQVDAQVVVSARSQCDLALQLEGVAIGGLADSAAAQRMQRQLEATPLVFGYSDGQVTDVCPAPDDLDWALNVKKSIVSALQMTAQSLDKRSVVRETDILGACQTVYEPVSARYGKHVLRRTKNLRACGGQQKWLTSFFFPRSFGPAPLSAAPFVSGAQECDQTLEADLIVGATCREVASLSQYAVASQLNLRFVSQRISVSAHNYPIRRHAHHLQMAHQWSSQASEAELEPTLRQLCQHVDQQDDQSEALKVFQRLIQVIQNSSPSATARALSGLQSKQICESQKVIDLFLDASAQSGSEGGAQALADWFKSGQSEQRAELIFQSLAFSSSPKAKAIEKLIPVLSEPKSGQLVILGISGLIHNAKNSPDQRAEAERQSARAIHVLLQKATSGEEKAKVVAIKALQNIGLESSDAARQQMARIGSDNKEAQSVRVAAWKALSESMSGKERALALKVVQSESESNEVRINAYKAVAMSGASEREIKEVQDFVRKTSNRNLKQYILSHQKNLRETSDPHKKDIAREGKWEEPSSQWAGLSNNFEGSFMLDALGVGAVVEADVIYERQSIPSSVTLNTTIPLFGREINVLEIEIRQKGFGAALERAAQELRRAQNVRKAIQVLTSARSDAKNAFLEISVKIDSKTLFVFNSNQKNANFETLFQPITDAFKRSTESALAFQPINARVQLPSTNGWPVIARLNATFLAQIKSQINAREVKVTPSLVWRAEAALEVNAHQQKRVVGVQTSGQMAPQWQSSHVISQKSANFKVNFNSEKISVLKAKIGLIGQQVNQQRQEKCSQATRQPLGLEFCFSQNSESLELFIRKSDKSLKSIEVEVSRDQNNYHVLFNTPNSQIDRHLEAQLQVIDTPTQRAVKGNVRSPWWRYSAQASLNDQEKDQSLQIEVTRDGAKQLAVDIGLETQARGQKREYRPRVKLQFGEQKEQISLQGTVGISKGRKNQLQINLEGNQKQFLKGSFVREGERKSSDIRVSTDLALQLVNGLEVRVNALLDKGLKHVTSDLNLEYRTRANQKKESLKVSLKVQNLTQSATRKMSAFAELTSTQFPWTNAHVAYNLLQKESEHVENELTVQWSQKLSRKVHVLQVTKASAQHVENTLTVEATPFQLNYEIKANANRDNDQIAAEVAGKDRTGQKQNDFRADFNYKHVSRAPLHLTLNANLKTEGNAFEYSDQLREESRGEFKGQTNVNWQTSGQQKKSAKVDYEYKIKSGSKDMDHEMALKVDHPFSDQPIRHKALLRMSRNTKHFKSELQINGKNYNYETLLSNQGPSRIQWEGLGYQIKGHAQPYQVPQVGGVEIVTPSCQHKTSIELIPRRALKIQSDTKSGQKNILAFNSDLSVNRPSTARFNSPAVSMALDADLTSAQKSANLVLSHVTQDWTHSSRVSSGPNSNYALESKTLSVGRPLLTIDGKFGKKSYLSVESPRSETSLSYSSVPKRSAKLLINNQLFRHQSQWEAEPDNTHFSSLQTIGGQNLFDIDYKATQDNARALKTQFNQNYGIDGTWSDGHVAINARAKRQDVTHKSTLKYGNNNYQFSSQTSKSGRNVAQIESQINNNPDIESHVHITSPYHVSRAFLTPSRAAKIEISSPSGVDHVTALEWSPKYAIDSKTTLNHVTYALAGSHAPLNSFASFKSPNYDISGHVDRDYNTPSAKLVISGPRVSHVTEVSANRDRKYVRVESKSDRKPSSANIYRFESQLNASPSDASVVALKLANAKIQAKIQPFAASKRFVNIQAESPAYSHVTDLELHPQNALSIRSRTNDVINGQNLAKIDSYLSPSAKSHVTIVSARGDANLELEPSRGARIDLTNDQWQHRTTLQTTDGVTIDSKTKRFGNDFFDFSSALSPSAAKLAFKGQQLEHVTQVSANRNLVVNSRTQLNQQLKNRINFDSDREMEFESPHFDARGQWSADHVTVDYKSKLPRGRHLLATIRVSPNDKNQFHAELAWDQQRDPNQRVTFDWSARVENAGGWGQKKAIHVVSASYAGNALSLESNININDVLRGPNNWNVIYTPKVNAEKERIEVALTHEIKDRQMACTLQYSEGKRETLFASLKSEFKNNSFVSSLTTRAPNNPQMEVHVEVNARVQDLRRNNAQLFAEVKAILAQQKEFSYVLDLKRANEEILGSIKTETPSGGQKTLRGTVNVSENRLEASFSDAEGKKAELEARAESRHVSLDLKSNLKGIPSLSLNGEWVPNQVAKASLDVDGERKVDAALIKTEESGGTRVTARLESPLLAKVEFKANLKKTSNEINFETEAKVDSKQVFSAQIAAQLKSGVWSGQGHVSQNGAEVARAALDSTFGQNSFEYLFSAKTRALSPIEVRFSAQTLNRETKVSLNACSQPNTCVDFSADVKRNGARVEKVRVGVAKVGANLELKISLNEEVDTAGASGQSVLRLSSGRVQWKVRNELSVSLNGHQMGVEALSQSRGESKRENEIWISFPNRKQLVFKSDFSSGSSKLQIEDNSSAEPILEAQLNAQQSGQEVVVSAQISSKKFRKSPKSLELRFEKPSSEQPLKVRLELDLSPQKNNALTLEAQLQTRPESENQNNTFSLKIFSKDKKEIDFSLKGHASSQTVGVAINNVDKRGRNKQVNLFVQSEQSSGDERRFQGNFQTNELHYKIDGAVKNNNKELSAIWSLQNEKNGEKSDQRVSVGQKCATWESRGSESRKYELCLNAEKKNDKSLELTVEETSGGGKAKQLSANLEVDTRGPKAVRLDVNWTPEAFKQWFESAGKSSYGQSEAAEVLNEIWSEVSEKSAFISRQMADEVVVPVLSLFSDQFSDLYQELEQNFESFARVSQISQQLLTRFASNARQMASLDVFSDFYRQTARNVRNECRQWRACYQLVYSIKNYGIQSLADWLQSNAIYGLKQTHKVVLNTSGRLYRSVSAPQWLRDGTQYYRQSASAVLQSIIESNQDLQSIALKARELFSELTKDWNQIDSQKVKQLFSDFLDIAFAGNSASRVAVYDPQNGRLQLEISSRAKRSVAEEVVKSRMF